MHLRHHPTQQLAAVGAGPGRIGVGEVAADVAQRAGAEQGIADRMQQHVAVGVGDEAAVEGNGDAADPQVVALAEAVDVEAVADSHHAVSFLSAEGSGASWAARIASASARSSG